MTAFNRGLVARDAGRGLLDDLRGRSAGPAAIAACMSAMLASTTVNEGEAWAAGCAGSLRGTRVVAHAEQRRRSQPGRPVPSWPDAIM